MNDDKSSSYKLGLLSVLTRSVGASFDARRGAIVTGAIRDTCNNINAMPARYITYPGQNRPILESQKNTVRLSGSTGKRVDVIPALPPVGSPFA